MFSNAIVKTPCRNMSKGLTSANLGKPDYKKSLQQHKSYIKALKQCGLKVKVLAPDENHPDSTFVEDTALLTPKFAIITNPGALSRKGEIVEIEKHVSIFYDKVEKIKEPGTVDAGDIMMVGDHYYIGLSGRTNQEGARQIISLLNQYGMTGSTVNLENVLHLKTGVAYLENNNLAACGEFLHTPEFQYFDILEIPAEESYAANCLWINGKVLVPAGFPKSREIIEKAGYSTILIDVSEFRKIDGGLSCLSLRF